VNVWRRAGGNHLKRYQALVAEAREGLSGVAANVVSSSLYLMRDAAEARKRRQ